MPAVDGRCDALLSVLGAILYQLLCDRLPIDVLPVPLIPEACAPNRRAGTSEAWGTIDHALAAVTWKRSSPKPWK